MFQHLQSLLRHLLLLSLMLLAWGCSPSLSKRTLFEVQPDESDFITYTFGGGEVGADATSVSIRGDGQVTYHYLLPYMGAWPQEQLTREHQLPPDELRTLWQSLVDAGLFDLKSQKTQGADVPRTAVQAAIDNHKLDVAFDGTPDERIHGQISRLTQTIHPAAGCYLSDLIDGFPLIERGASRAELILCLGEPAEVQSYALPTEPFLGPAEGLVNLLDPGTPIEEWIYQDDDTRYYFWFASNTGEAEAFWRLIEKATYPKDVVF
ncbi:MAG: hypothetical protein KDI79_00010 [Anaerolineae bacterium]|nr:hypothetical protein [Anaerolineae bacterium]